MSTPLRLGFVPLCDAAALIVAHAKGMFAEQGLTVELSREASWATVRDKLAVGALDGAQMLAPMAIAQTLGLGCDPVEMAAPLALGQGAAAVTVASRLELGADCASGLADLVSRRRDIDASPLTFSVVFPYSVHNYLLRDWLSRAGVDPDRDVRLTVAAPPRMAELLAGGVIEGFCAGEPWSAVASRAGVGRVVVRARDFTPTAPDKVFATTRTWANANAQILDAILKALSKALIWAGDMQNRGELAALLARPEHMDVGADAIADGLEHLVFRPSSLEPAQTHWLFSQMQRWGHVVESDRSPALRVFEAFGAASAGAGA